MLEQDVLLDLLVRKDNRAYQYLYQCYYVALKALASYYVKDNDVAEDLVQDVFISLLESRNKFETANGVKYFLYSSLKNKCISHFRKQKIRDKYYKDIISSQTEEEHFWDKVLEEDVYTRLMAAVETERLHISLDTVKEHKSSGKKKLAAQLKDAELRCLIWLLWF